MKAAGPAGTHHSALPERRIIQRGLYFEEFEEDVVSTIRDGPCPRPITFCFPR